MSRTPVAGSTGGSLAGLALVALLLSACQNRDGPPAQGACTPTVPGGGPAAFADAASAREAYTRRSRDGTLEATLEDVSWLRFEGTPEQVEAAHRSYFQYGYTTIQVVLRPIDFTQPTRESFLLEDDRGQQVRAKPITYRSTSMAQRGNRFEYFFELSFPHALSGAKWVRLTREFGGQSVEWKLS
jgi:hypothetical protein